MQRNNRTPFVSDRSGRSAMAEVGF